MFLTDRRSLVVWGGLTLSAFPACTACSGDAPGMPLDGGSDRRMVNSDAGVSDASLGVPDAPPDIDVGYNPFVGTWGSIPNAPPGCFAKLDMDPQKDIGDLQWVACPTKRPGCRRLVVNWTSNWGYQFNVETIRVVNGVPYMTYGRVYPKTGNPNVIDAFIEIVAPLDKPAIFAFGDYSSPAICSGRVSASNAGIFMWAVAPPDPDRPFFLRSSFATPQQLSITQHTRTEMGLLKGGGLDYLAAQGPTMFFGTSDPFSITVYDPFSDTVKLVMDGIARPDVERPKVVRDGVIATDGASTRGFVFVGPDASWKKLHVPTPPNQVLSIVADPSNNDTFAWMEGQPTGLDYTNVKLYTSPYSTVAAQPKQVTGIATLYNNGGGMIANAGMALLLTSFTTAELVRLSDGWGWSIPAELEDGWITPIWVDDTDVWLLVAPRKWNGQYINGVVRIGRSSLGPPTIPPQ